MIKRFVRYLILAVTMIVLPFVVIAEELPVLDCMYWVSNMQKIYQEKNFQLTLVKSSNTEVEPVLFTHGVIGNKSYLHWLYLNGMPNGFYTTDNNLVYFLLNKDKIVMPNAKTPTLFTRFLSYNIQNIQENYKSIITGKVRIANRDAISVQLISKNNERYNFDLWFDETSGILLQMQVIDSLEGLRESFYAVSLVELESPHEIIKTIVDASNEQTNLSDINVPSDENADLNWDLLYIPQGFKKVFSQKYFLPNSNVPVEHVLYTDNLVDFSVYKIKAIDSMNFQVVKENTLNLYRHVVNDQEIVVIGELPLHTLKKVAEGYKYK